MSGFIEGESRSQATLFPESLDEYISEDSAARVIDIFIDDLDITGLVFKAEPNATGQLGNRPKTMLKQPEPRAVFAASGARSAAQRRGHVCTT